MKRPIPALSQGAGSCTASVPPRKAPPKAPPANHAAIIQSTWRIWTMARPALDPICTTPWTGTSAAAGITIAMMASKVTPPPRPTAAVMADVAKLEARSKRAGKTAKSGGERETRKSIIGPEQQKGRHEPAFFSGIRRLSAVPFQRGAPNRNTQPGSDRR